MLPHKWGHRVGARCRLAWRARYIFDRHELHDDDATSLTRRHSLRRHAHRSARSRAKEEGFIATSSRQRAKGRYAAAAAALMILTTRFMLLAPQPPCCSLMMRKESDRCRH